MFNAFYVQRNVAWRCLISTLMCNSAYTQLLDLEVLNAAKQWYYISRYGLQNAFYIMCMLMLYLFKFLIKGVIQQYFVCPIVFY